ncbi:MAG TPA: hypothetical protein VM692_07945 [Gammaproteobacteria bacterium]|nr:hypothetical protein [Gammaproteobacteria bacterium]
MVGALAARLGKLTLALQALPSAAFAHRLDEYLQATLVAIEPGRIELSIRLTPGVDVADAVLEHIDFDRDGRISESESATYSELVRRDFELRVDRETLELATIAAVLPTPAELRTGEGIIELELVAEAALAPGRHVLVLANRHDSRIGAYLFNASLPRSPTIAIAQQRRNADQSIGEIDFTVAPSATAATP